MSTVLGGFNVLPPVGIITGETMWSTNGQLGVGVYKYVFTYATNFGETTASPASQAITSANSILITIPVGQAEVKTKHVYRTTLGGSIFKLLVILSNDVSTYLDVSPDAALGDTPPVANWASSAQVCDGWTKFSKPIVYSVGNITAAGLDRDSATLIEVENAYVAVPSNLQGVVLPMIKDDLVGQKFIINNTSATNQLRIYPATTEIINGQPAGDPYVLGAGMAAQIISSSLTSWNTRNTTTTLPASLISISSLATSGNEMLYTVASNTYATSIISAAGRSFMSESSPAGQRAAIGVVIGADVAAYSPNLTSLATIGGLPANNMVYTTGSGYANSTISPYARSLLANTTATSMRGGIGLSYLPADTNSGYNLSSDVVVGMSAAQTLHNKTIGADNNVVIGANTSFNGLPFSTVAIPANGDVLRVVGGALELSAVNYGDVYGPASATSGALAVFGDSSGKLLANSSITLTGANLAGIGTLAATTVNSTTINATTLGGTLSTAAQPNVTSVGSLSSLAVVGSANMGGVLHLMVTRLCQRPAR